MNRAIQMKNILTKQVPYLKCDQGNLHLNENLDAICFDKKCPKRGLICTVCQDESHALHETLPLKAFLNSLYTQVLEQNENNQEMDNECSNFEETLIKAQEIQQQAFFKLKESIQVLSNHVKSVEQKLIEFHQNVINSLNKQEENKKDKGQSEIIDQILEGNFTKVTNLKEKIINLMDKHCTYKNEILTLNKQKTTNSTISFYNQFVSQIGDKMSVLQTKLKEQFKLVENSISQNNEALKINQDGAILPQQSLNCYKFSELEKGKHIKISQENTIAEQIETQSYENRFAVIDPVLSNSISSYIAFKVTKLANWVGVGLCDLDVMKQNNFSFNNGNICHASYLISNNKYSWSHHNTNDNSVVKSFQFKINDIVLVCYNPLQQTVYFKKKGSSEKTDNFQLKVDQGLTGSKHFCINMCSAGDSLGIVDIQNEDILEMENNNCTIGKKPDILKSQTVSNSCSESEEMGCNLFGDDDDDSEDEY